MTGAVIGWRLAVRSWRWLDAFHDRCCNWMHSVAGSVHTGCASPVAGGCTQRRAAYWRLRDAHLSLMERRKSLVSSVACGAGRWMCSVTWQRSSCACWMFSNCRSWMYSVSGSALQLSRCTVHWCLLDVLHLWLVDVFSNRGRSISCRCHIRFI